MVKSVSIAVRLIAGAAAMALLLISLTATDASAQRQRTIVGERYVPTIWIDPDGCEHWVIDNGIEGYMTPNRTQDGRPVCHRTNVCLTESTDTLFATGSHSLRPGAADRLAAFFRSRNDTAFVVYGHTDPRGGFEYNMALSENRARVVANVAIANGGRVATVRGFGPMNPVASNNSAAGMQQNRRVEVLCVQ
ncbi:OmpA family protein [Pararhodobacter zhoushanensis]|uniref:OmpA family protein n=1 Tax=Pararhodobacter zhoushanensis TaxID=2479545 RepID=A0ABT3GZ05_9RHOB|nr:OmpA family protein [Pararhodobacter zhoushanensis]MCW1932764.1 OmpA family protein [Pararhodobacter zhoushanensis]